MADKRVLMPVKLVDASGSTTPNQLAIPVTGAAVANSTAGGVLQFGSDGTNYRVINTDTGGKLNVNATQAGTWAVSGTGTAGTPATGVVSVQGVVSGTAIPVSGTFWQATQPVSGTVTANAGTGTFAISAAALPLPSGASTSANQTSLISAIGSTTSGQSGTMAMGATTTAAPTYTTAQTNPLSLTTAGALRVDGSAVTQPVSGTFWQTTQPVSGTVTANAGSGNFNVLGTGTAGTAATGVVTVQGIASMTPIKVDGSGVTQPVSGTVTANAGTGTFTVSGTVTSNIGTTNGLALDATVAKLTIAQGAATSTNTGALIQGVATTAAPTYTTATINPLSLDTAGNLRVNVVAGGGASGVVAQSSATSGESGMLTQGAVTTSSPTYTTGNTNPISLTTAGALRVDASATTQPISGAVTANAGTGTFTVSGTVTANAGTGTFAISAAALPLPTGAATSANQTSLIAAQASTTSGQSGTLSMGATTTASPTYTTAQTNPLSLTTAGALRVDASATTQPVSGTFWQATQPVSGTVAATQSGTWNITNISGTVSLPTGAATAANQPTATTIGSTTSGQTGHIVMGAVTTAAPTYTTAQTNPLSLTTGGALRVDASATTQPVSGTVTANAGTGTFAVSGTVTANAGTGTMNIAGTGSAGTPATGIVTVQGNASGTPIPVTGVFTDDLPTTPVISAQTSSAVAAGSSATLTTGDIGAQFLWGIDIACSVAYKAVIGIIANGTTTNYAILFGRSGETIQWKPASRKFFGSTASAGIDGFSIIITNQDTSDAADVYATFYYAAT